MRIDRQPASFLNDAPTPTPPNWHSFCDAVDAELVPLTESKNFYLNLGRVLQLALTISVILSVFEFLVLDLEWFNKIIGALGLYTFLPFGIMLVSGLLNSIVSFVFMLKLDRRISELKKVASEYSVYGGCRYEVGLDYEGSGKRRYLVCFYIMVHTDNNAQIDVELQPIDGKASANEGLPAPAVDAGEKNNSSAPPTFEYNLL